jgi:hypothetical protein
MGRVFTVSFRFMEHPCTALVSMQNQESYNPAFSVHYLDKEVETVLPERKIVFSLVNGIESPANIQDIRAKQLIEKTSEAISHYLEVYS